MFNNLISDWERPDRFETKSRDDIYHINWGRFSVANAYNLQHSLWLNQVDVNTNFLFDQQWILEEDKEAFFKDSTNQSKNRIKVQKNFIKPNVLQYMGNAIIMDMNIRAKAISPRAANRREESLEELLFFTDVANNSSPEYANYLRTQYPIGNTGPETEQLFEHLYKDDFVTGINYFMDYISEENRFEEKKMVSAFDLTRAGIALLAYYVHNNEFKWRRVLPEQFYFDRSAYEPDLSDAAFMGYVTEMVPSEIFEKWNKLSIPEKKAIEAESRRMSNYNVDRFGGKIYVFTSFWKDFEDQEYGYVLDEFDYPYLARINHTYQNELKPRFTDKDLIPVKSLNDDQKEVLRGKNKAVIPVDVMRYIEFIPHEIVSVPYLDSMSLKRDIVLDYGVFPHQDTENEKVDSVQWPIKVATWVYHKGFIDTPINSQINPQRMINRYASVEEQQISSNHGKSLFYDEGIIGDSLEGEDELLNNMYQGKPTGVNARGQGLANMIGEFGSTVSKDTLIYEDLQRLMKESMDDMSGVHETMRGETQGANKLVGVTQLEIQRSSLIQEPFYDALARLFLQVYQATANIGKRVYVSNQRKMAIAVGDSYTKVLQLTDEYNAEDFRAFIYRQPDKYKQQQAVNEMLLLLKQGDLIDDVRFAQLFNNGTFDDVASAMRKYAGEKMMVAKEQAEKMEQQAAEQQAKAEDLMMQQREDDALKEAAEMADSEQDRMSQERRTAMKESGKRAEAAPTR